MLRGPPDRLAARFGTDEEANEGETEDTRFVPSELDVSVRYAHGPTDTVVEREIAEIEEEARRLDEQQRGG